MNAVARDYRSAGPRDFTDATRPALRLAEMAETMRELAHSPEGATEAALAARGFTLAEILEYAVEAAALAARASQADSARFDRVPDMLVKALAALPHNPPRVGGHDLDEEGLKRWSAFCAARAAFKLDPWSMQGERALQKLNDALRRLPLLDNERARVVAGLAAEQKVTITRGRT